VIAADLLFLVHLPIRPVLFLFVREDTILRLLLIRKSPFCELTELSLIVHRVKLLIAFHSLGRIIEHACAYISILKMCLPIILGIVNIFLIPWCLPHLCNQVLG
jgi:hypothetical protein